MRPRVRILCHPAEMNTFSLRRKVNFVGWFLEVDWRHYYYYYYYSDLCDKVVGRCVTIRHEQNLAFEFFVLSGSIQAPIDFQGLFHFGCNFRHGSSGTQVWLQSAVFGFLRYNTYCMYVLLMVAVYSMVVAGFES